MRMGCCLGNDRRKRERGGDINACAIHSKLFFFFIFQTCLREQTWRGGGRRVCVCIYSRYLFIVISIASAHHVYSRKVFLLIRSLSSALSLYMCIHFFSFVLLSFINFLTHDDKKAACVCRRIKPGWSEESGNHMRRRPIY
jgi:hypothetical protein